MDGEESSERFYEIPQNDDVIARRRELISRIESVIQDIVTSIARNEKPKLSFNDGKNSGWSKKGSSNAKSETVSIDGPLKTIQFRGYKSRQRFAVVARVLSYAHKKLLNHLDRTVEEFYCTKRAFWYSLKNEDVKRFVDSQRKIDWAIDVVLLALECAPWEIGFITTSKGLVAGDLSLYVGDSKVMNYDQRSCQAVPHVLANVTRVRTTAKFVFVVEKDSVFQYLLREDCPAFNNCILVTGKGYPDVPTRMLVRLLSEIAHLPVYAFVDANPYGFEIMCVYRFGTSNNSGYREQLICPKMRWLGVHHVDLIRLGIQKVKLTKADLKKIEDLQSRNYGDVNFSDHLIEMKFGKAEIESVIKQVETERFITEIFIPAKIRKKECY